MKLKFKYIFLILFSIVLSNDANIDYILDKSFNRLKSQDIAFDCDIKVQSISKQPEQLKFSFLSHWSDSSSFYAYIKFISPVDYKNIEIWSHHSEDVTVKRRMPLNKEIVTIENDFEGLDIVSFLNFNNIYDEINSNEISVNNSKFKNEEIYIIKSFKKKNKRKTIKFYISKNDYRVIKVEWTNKRGGLNKVLLFEDWENINNLKLSKKIIFEDIKKKTKTTCKLSNLSLEKLSNEQIELIMLGFGN